MISFHFLPLFSYFFSPYFGFMQLLSFCLRLRFHIDLWFSRTPFWYHIDLWVSRTPFRFHIDLSFSHSIPIPYPLMIFSHFISILYRLMIFSRSIVRHIVMFFSVSGGLQQHWFGIRQSDSHDHRWNQLLVIAGWYTKLYQPQDRRPSGSIPDHVLSLLLFLLVCHADTGHEFVGEFHDLFLRFEWHG